MLTPLPHLRRNRPVSMPGQLYRLPFWLEKAASRR